MAAIEQVVVFRAGRYVSMVQLASATSTSNPAALSRSQAITVSFQQYQLLHLLDPAGATATGPVDAARRP